MLCLECGKDSLRRTNDPIEEEFKGKHITVKDVDHWVCDACGELAFDGEDLEAMTVAEVEAYREAAGLLSSEEIKEIRKKIGATQEQFEKILGVSAPTLSRWERGMVVQKETADNLMRLLSMDAKNVELLAGRVGIDLPLVAEAKRSRRAGFEKAHDEKIIHLGSAFVHMDKGDQELLEM